MRALIGERPAASIQEIFLLSLHYYFFPKKRKKRCFNDAFYN